MQTSCPSPEPKASNSLDLTETTAPYPARVLSFSISGGNIRAGPRHKLSGPSALPAQRPARPTHYFKACPKQQPLWISFACFCKGHLELLDIRVRVDDTLTLLPFQEGLIPRLDLFEIHFLGLVWLLTVYTHGP